MFTITQGDENRLKAKIEEIVQGYVHIYAVEFGLFRDGMKKKRERLLNEFAATKNTDLIERELYEIPETLYNILDKRLAPIELVWLRSRKGAIWFAKKFKNEFAVGTQI